MKVFKVSAPISGEEFILLAQRGGLSVHKPKKNKTTFTNDAKRLVELFGYLPKGTVDKFFKIYQKHQERQRTRL